MEGLLNIYQISMVTTVSIAVIMALSLNLSTGFCGQISLGQADSQGSSTGPAKKQNSHHSIKMANWMSVAVQPTVSYDARGTQSSGHEAKGSTSSRFGRKTESSLPDATKSDSSELVTELS